MAGQRALPGRQALRLTGQRFGACCAGCGQRHQQGEHALRLGLLPRAVAALTLQGPPGMLLLLRRRGAQPAGTPAGVQAGLRRTGLRLQLAAPLLHGLRRPPIGIGAAQQQALLGLLQGLLQLLLLHRRTAAVDRLDLALEAAQQRVAQAELIILADVIIIGFGRAKRIQVTVFPVAGAAEQAPALLGLAQGLLGLGRLQLLRGLLQRRPLVEARQQLRQGYLLGRQGQTQENQTRQPDNSHLRTSLPS